MFDWVRNNKRIMQVLLVLIAIPFALFGVESYQRMFSSADEAATVDGSTISMGEFNRASQQQLDSFRQMLGGNFDASVWDTPAFRQNVLDGLINQRIALQFSLKSNLTASDQTLQQAIASVPAFQENGAFSTKRYSEVLRAQNYAPVQFQEGLRQELTVKRLVGGISDSAIASKALAEQALSRATEQRVVSRSVFAPKAYAGKVSLTDEALSVYYKENTKAFEVPARGRVEYVLLTPQTLMDQEKIDPAEVRKVYDERFAAALAQRDAARRKADDILADLRAHPEHFEESAKTHSNDPGSAARGGDLGYFARGSMVKPFEDAAFKLKPGQISGLVETGFGFHIIKVTGTKAGASGEERQASHILITAPEGARPFADMKASMESDLRRQRAGARYAKVVEELQNLADQQNDTLAPFVEKFGLAVITTDWITRQADPKLGAIASPKVLDVLFGDDSMKTRRATEAIEATPGNIVVARLAEVRAAEQPSFDSVRAEIEARLTQREAARLAHEAGAAVLAALKTGTDARTASTLTWTSPQTLQRDKAGSTPAEVMRAVFSADGSRLPAYAAADDLDGYVVYRIEKVSPGAVPAPEQLTQSVESMRRALGQDDLRVFVDGLRARAKVVVNAENVARR